MRLCRCGSIVNGKCRCDKSTAQHKEFYSSWAWTQLSLRKRTADPLCECCLEDGKVTPASEVHHVVGVDESESLRMQWDNLMSVCSECHDKLEGRRRKHV